TAQSHSPDAAAPNPSYAALADLLENEQTRDKLIEQLRNLAPDTHAADITPLPSAESAAEAEPSLSQRIAISLQEFTADIAQDTKQSLSVLRATFNGESVPGNHLHTYWPALNLLLFTILGTLAAY